MYIYDKNDRIVGKDDGIAEKVIWSIVFFVLIMAALFLAIGFFV